MRKDIFEQIHEDHTEVNKLIEQLRTQPERNPEQVVSRIMEDLVPHSKAEEMSLYPWLGQHAQARSQVQQSMEEHRQVERLLDTFEDALDDVDQLEAKTNQLHRMIEQHVAREESTIFDLARDLLSQDQLNEMARRFPEDKDRFRQEWRMAA